MTMREAGEQQQQQQQRWFRFGRMTQPFDPENRKQKSAEEAFPEEAENSTSHLHPVDDVLDISEQVLGQHQPQPGLALNRLVHIDVHVYRPVALQQQLLLSEPNLHHEEERL